MWGSQDSPADWPQLHICGNGHKSRAGESSVQWGDRLHLPPALMLPKRRDALASLGWAPGRTVVSPHFLTGGQKEPAAPLIRLSRLGVHWAGLALARCPPLPSAEQPCTVPLPALAIRIRASGSPLIISWQTEHIQSSLAFSFIL